MVKLGDGGGLIEGGEDVGGGQRDGCLEPLKLGHRGGSLTVGEGVMGGDGGRLSLEGASVN